MENGLLAPALEAKKRLSELIRQSGIRAAVGVTKEGRGHYALKVSLQRGEPATELVPNCFEGLPVLVEVTGKVRAFVK